MGNTGSSPSAVVLTSYCVNGIGHVLLPQQLGMVPLGSTHEITFYWLCFSLKISKKVSCLRDELSGAQSVFML
jgi:hypothetical protein